MSRPKIVDHEDLARPIARRTTASAGDQARVDGGGCKRGAVAGVTCALWGNVAGMSAAAKAPWA